ncbi:MAG TPA: hypothetical protein VJG30_01560 [Candidatus Nanoarchaeia archaeon]|nr:hypothetical protein [Candidatus Nanoarchaeia archaeon]
MGELKERLERIIDPAIRVSTIEGLTDEEVAEHFDDLITYRDGVVDTLNAVSTRMINIAAKASSSKRRVKIEKPAIPYNPKILRLDPNTLTPTVNHRIYLELLANKYAVDIREITERRNGKCDKEIIKRAYREAVYTLRKKYGLGFQRIGRLLGRDSSTVHGTYRSICNELGVQP